MRVLGIDPGTQIVGYGVVEKTGGQVLHVDNGCVSTKGRPLALRLQEIYQSLLKTIKLFRPDAIAIEEIFFSKNVSVALKLGESRGVALLAAAELQVPIYEYSPREVKQAVTGYGQAGKEQVQKMIQRLLHLPEVAQVDASDALAVALCHAHSSKLLRIVA